MAVQQAAHRIANRFVEVVAFNQHGKEPGDRTALEVSRAFEYLWQEMKHRRSVTLLARRLPGCETDFPLPEAAGQQAIDGANAGFEKLGDVLARKRRGRCLVEIIRGRGCNRRAAIHGPSEAVEHASL